MPVIGEELRALLGMIPVRDRAGIARGNLAQETLANEANAEGQALLQQVNTSSPGVMPRPAPPPLQIPPTMGTGRPGPVDPATTGSVEPPTPTRTTTMTAPPAGAAAQFEGEMARRAKMAGFNDIVSSLGMIINGAANRGASQGSTRDTLLAGMGSGGMSVPEVIATDKHRQELIALDEARRNRENRIQAYQRETGADRERATAAVDTDNDKKALDPATIKTRAGDKLVAGSRERILANPKLIKQMADDAGVSVEMMTEKLKAGEYLDTKTQADVAHTRGVTAKTAVDAASTAAATREALQSSAHREDVRNNPEKYVPFYKGATADQLRQYAQSEKSWEEFNKGQTPSLDPLQQRYWTTYVPQETAAGNKPKSFDEWSKDQTKAGVPVPEDIGTREGVVAAGKKMDESAETARNARQAILDRHVVQDLWKQDMLTGGLGAEAQTDLRLTWGRLFGVDDEQARDTKVFFSALKRNIQASSKGLAGPLSDKDIKFLGEMEGGQTLDAMGIRNLEIIHEKLERAKMEKHNTYYAEQTGRPKLEHLKEFYQHYDPPGPGRFIREDLADNPEVITKLMKNQSPKAMAAFDKEYGRGVAAWLIKNEGRLD